MKGFFGLRSVSSKRDKASLYAAGIGLSLIALAIIFGKGTAIFFNLNSLFIVLGGTFGATLITFSIPELQKAFSLIRKSLFSIDYSHDIRTSQILEMSTHARQEGVLSLERYLSYEQDSFLKKAIVLVTDSIPPEDIKRILRLELSYRADEQKKAAQVFQTMGTIAPAMGLIGTLIGLVQMLQHLENPSLIGPSMAVALLTTFYGAIFAHIVFLPIAGKLARSSQEASLLKQMTIEGMASIAEGTNPRLIEQNMMSFLPEEKAIAQVG